MPNEDLFTNPFFVTLRKKFGKLYKEAEDFCYMICIPQKKMVRNRKITREDIGVFFKFFSNYLLLPDYLFVLHRNTHYISFS